eukprot:1194032-Prorocentrum_minimum.AAC.7
MALLEWDELVMMADGSADARAAQKAALAEVIHERKVSSSPRPIPAAEGPSARQGRPSPMNRS